MSDPEPLNSVQQNVLKLSKQVGHFWLQLGLALYMSIMDLFGVPSSLEPCPLISWPNTPALCELARGQTGRVGVCSHPLIGFSVMPYLHGEMVIRQCS